LKLKRASMITKLVVLAVFCYLIITTLSLQNDIAAYRDMRNALQLQVNTLQMGNEALRLDIASSNDSEHQESIARNKLGLVMPGEKVFIDITN
jgi:Septum formation initiator